jgi:hypothetical protein
MNNLNSVTVGQNRLRPLVAPNYLLIEFDGDSRRRQRQFADEIVQRRPVPHFAIFTVDLNQQGFGFQLRKTRPAG